ncbi:enoyl-CoA hydratase [Geodermatophilus sp. URMC 64]
MSEQDAARVRVERPEAAVMRIVLARPEARNAQDPRMLYELNDAFDLAAQDDEVKVVILAADGPHFSAGHDLFAEWTVSSADRPVGCWGGFALPGAEGYMAVEEELFLGLCWRWRNFPKPTIAATQGRTIAGGLMLAWSCDLIIAAKDASFSDPVVAFGVNGHEFFLHAWEFGGRKAKELLFTGGAVDADEACRLGMVNHVVDPAELDAEALRIARRIARMPSMGLKLAKQAVNQSLDAQGQWSAVQSAFSLHQLGHSHNRELHGVTIDPDGAAIIRELSSPPS